jgi:hypothetical protein
MHLELFVSLFRFLRVSGVHFSSDVNEDPPAQGHVAWNSGHVHHSGGFGMVSSIQRGEGTSTMATRLASAGRWAWQSRAVPGAILISAAVALGCMPGGGYPRADLSLNNRLIGLFDLYQPKINAPLPADSTVVQATILGLRWAEGGPVIDVLLAGQHARRVAVVLEMQGSSEGRRSTLLPQLLSMRQVEPEARPVRVAWDSRRPSRIVHAGMSWPSWTNDTTGVVQRGLGSDRVMMTIPLDTEPRMKQGRYEVRLTVPPNQGPGNPLLADVRDVNLNLDLDPVLTDFALPK